MLICLVSEHIEAEKEEDSALRTPSPDSDEPTEGNLLIYINALYLHGKKMLLAIKVKIPVQMCKKYLLNLDGEYYCKLLYTAYILQNMNKKAVWQCKGPVSLCKKKVMITSIQFL